MIILFGESGSGKSTIEAELVKRGHSKVVSYTTREPRYGEKHGVNYYFTDITMFSLLVREDLLGEYTEYQGNYYGASKKDLATKDILVAELNGIKQIKEQGIEATIVYLQVPKLERAKRMLGRGDSREKVYKRIEGDEENFKNKFELADYIVVNYDLESTVEQIEYLLKKRGVEGYVRE